MIGIDKTTRETMWTYERFCSTDQLKVKKGAFKFRIDLENHPKSMHDIHEQRCSSYSGSGYDRGHFACAANHKSSPADNRSTFIYSNAAPMLPFVNQKLLAIIEKFMRELADETEVIIFTGGIRGKETICNQRFVTNFFKIALVPFGEQFISYAFNIPHKVIFTIF